MNFRCLCGLLLFLLPLLSTRCVHAQLATSFYNVTGIETKVLPNAVRIVIRTDGTLRFGGDLSEWISFENFSPKPTTAFRLRLPGARAQLPAFVNIGTYPVESAVITPGRVDMAFPFFRGGVSSQTDPRVDIELRFFVPVRVQRFAVDDDEDITFSSVLGALETSVELGQDRSSIIITVVPDRTDFNALERLRRSPQEEHNHRLSISGAGEPPSTRFRVDALHTPLPQLLDAAAQAMNLQFIDETGANGADVSLFLPSATPEEFLRALGAYDLVVSPGPDARSFAIGRGASLPQERITLQNLAPERARLLLPDFLLPALRIDRANSALLIAATPAVVQRVRSDLAKLDLPRPQVRVEATAWEFASPQEMRMAISAAYTGTRHGASFDTATGAFSVQVGPNEVRAFRSRIEALVARGQVRLAAKPSIVVASGETGTLFVGQTRFVQVLRQSGGVTEPTALRLQIGYTLTVTPRAGAAENITLDLAPRVSTVDEIEVGSGLPTLGIREANSVVRVRPDDAVIVGGLDANLAFETSGRSLPSRIPLIGRLFRSRRSSRSQTATLLLVTARKV
ncbi:MAG TPA: hypothetical protein VF600_18475 [Abditibacteriaceae bacterium]|jgi:hypothetical protein